MGISFNEIPNGTRVPFIFVEFDTSKAQQGPSLQIYKALLIGQRLSTGTKPAGQVDLVTSEDQAKKFYGNGSMLASMVASFLAENKVTGLSCIALDDDGGAVKASGQIDFAGTATEAGTLSVMVAGIRYRIGVSSTDTDATVVANLVAEIQADDNRQVDVAINGGDTSIMDITSRHAGEVGNEIDIRLNHFTGEELPAGITAVITAMSGGTANPDIASAITAMGDDQYHVIGYPYTDASNMTAIETEMGDRFGPIRQIEGQVFTSKRDSFANLVTFGDSRNSAHMSTMPCLGPSNPWEWAAASAAVVGKFGSIDPARPFQTLEISSVVSPKESEVFSFTERDLLLKDGICSFKLGGGGVVLIERMITMFQTNALGAPDTSLLDVNTLLTLSYLRFDFRTQIQLKYPRHKLAGDEIRIAPGQAIITPKVGKAEAISIFRGWEELGLVENIDQFKRDLIVERNSQDVNRLDFLLPPDLVNQFRVAGVQIGFLL